MWNVGCGVLVVGCIAKQGRECTDSTLPTHIQWADVLNLNSLVLQGSVLHITCIVTHIHTDIQTYRHTDIQTDRQTDRQKQSGCLVKTMKCLLGS